VQVPAVERVEVESEVNLSVVAVFRSIAAFLSVIFDFLSVALAFLSVDLAFLLDLDCLVDLDFLSVDLAFLTANFFAFLLAPWTSCQPSSC